MKKNFLRLFVGFGAVIMLLGLADSGFAQRNRRETRGRSVSKAQVKVIVKRVEDRVDNFARNFDKSLDRSRLDGTDREDWLNKRASDLESATDELAREFDRRDAWIENKEEVRRCLKIASDIDQNVRRSKYGRTTEANWSRVRSELNTLADVYNLPKVSAMVYN